MSGNSLNRQESTTKKDLDYEPTDSYECCAQWSLLLVNLPMMLIGIAFVILGVWNGALLTLALQSSEGQGLFTAIFVLFLVIGVVLMVISVLGCIASLIESKVTLIVYYSIVLCVFFTIIIFVVVAYTYQAGVSDTLRADMRASIADYDPGRVDDPVTVAWDRTQKELQCCGIMAPAGEFDANATKIQLRPWEAWLENKMLNSGGDADASVPQSCCVALDDGGSQAECNDDSNRVHLELIYKSDCFDSAANFLQEHVELLLILGMIFALVLILSASLSICLYCLVE